MTPPMQKLDLETGVPSCPAHADAINQNAGPHRPGGGTAAGAACRRPDAGADPGSPERYEIQFTRGGARLDSAGKARMAQINQRLATLFTVFSQNELADEDNYQLVLIRIPNSPACPKLRRPMPPPPPSPRSCPANG